MPDRTVVDAALQAAAKPDVRFIEPDVVLDAIVQVPPGWRLERVATEELAATPRRARGRIVAHDAASFVTVVRGREKAPNAGVVYADEEQLAIVAILNDDTPDSAGWRDYRVELSLRRTPEWLLWRGHDGQLLSQESFAEHIENGLTELVEPEPAVMLEVAQTIQGTTAAAWKGGTRLASGAVQFRYEEDVSAAAGSSGQIQIPDRLKIVTAPFIGSARYEVGAWFRYRLTRDAGLRLGYKLDRPHEVERAAFADIRSQVTEGLAGATIVAGPAPLETEAFTK